jgi:hypothetical protein
VDFGASHNLLKEDLARKLGLRVGSCGASIKAINSKDKAIVGVKSTNHM